MRWNVLLIAGMGLVTFLAVLPEGEQPNGALQEKYDRGFNEGYQCASRMALDAAEARHLGEYYYDVDIQRHSFRWFCDEAEAARVRPIPPSAAVPEPPPRRVTQLTIDADLRDEFVARRRAG